MSRPLGVEDYCAGVLAGERRVVAKTITLLESRRPDHVALGQQVLARIVPESGRAVRLGITGPPGVGKSTLIETLGLELLTREHRVAVLAVDPSSPLTGGSILGDKTRMVRLSREERAFIRPSPSGLTLGGVAHRTREAMLVCEAAGYDVVIVETVGVGQSESEVSSMVDFFAVMLQPGAGDELQGIKRGILELADALVVNKADADQKAQAERTRAAYTEALHLLHGGHTSWSPQVLAVSALEGTGVTELWDVVCGQRSALEQTGELEQRRRRQAGAWLWRLLREGLEAGFRADPAIAEALPHFERGVEERTETAPGAALALLERFRRSKGGVGV